MTTRLLLHMSPMRAGEPVPPLLLHDHCLHLLAAVSWSLGAACHISVQGGCCMLGPNDSSRQPALRTCSPQLDSMHDLTVELCCRS